MSFNSAEQYALLQHWSTDTTQWSGAQRQKFLEWSMSAMDTVQQSTTFSNATNFMNMAGSDPDNMGSTGVPFIEPVKTGDHWSAHSDWANRTPEELDRLPFIPDFSSDDSSIGSYIAREEARQSFKQPLFDEGTFTGFTRDRASTLETNPDTIIVSDTGIRATSTSTIAVSDTGIRDTSPSTIAPESDFIQSDANFAAAEQTRMNTRGALADNWHMEEISRSSSRFVTKPVTKLDGMKAEPVYDLSELQKLVPKEEFERALSTNILDYDAMGNGAFSIDGILGSIKGNLVGVGVGAVIGPLLEQLQKSGPIGQVVAGGIGTLGATSILWDADPVTFAFMGLQQLAAGFMEQNNRIAENNYASDTNDSRLMMVLDNGTYYPAILKDREKGEGLWDSSNTINVAYGRPEDLTFSYEDGKYRGHFKNQKNKNFRMGDDEWAGENSTLEHAEKRDFMRPFYFLSQKESADALSGYGTNDFAWKTIEQDTSSFTPFMREYSDLQSSLDLLQNYEQKTGDGSSFLESPSKGMRQLINQRLADGEHAFEEDTFQNSRSLPKAGDNYGFNTWWDSYTGPGEQGLPSMHDLCANLLPRKITALTETQRLASKSIGLDDKYTLSYRDYAKDLPAAANQQELNRQLSAIANYTDRNGLQKQFLTEKAGVRYLMKKVNTMGYNADLYQEMRYQKSIAVTPPVWKNKDETNFTHGEGLSGWQTDDLNYWNRWETNETTKANDALGVSIDELIKQNGMKTREMNVEDEIRKEKQFSLPVIPEELPQTTGELIYDLITGTWTKTKGKKRKNTETPVKGYKQHFQKIMDQWHAEEDRKTWKEQDAKNTLRKFAETYFQTTAREYVPMLDNYTDTGEKITYKSFLDRINDPFFDPSALGVDSYTDIIQGMLTKSNKWIPDNVKLGPQNIPDFWVKKETFTHFQPLIQRIDEMSDDIKHRASYLNDLVQKQEGIKYMNKYHPEVALTDQNVPEKDDWSLPLLNRQNSVEFNHQIHRQMDFNYDETI